MTALRALLLLAAVVWLAACEATVSTEVTVLGDATAELEVAVTFSGDAAEAVREDAALQRQVEDVFTSRGLTPSRAFSSSQVTYRTTVDYAELESVSSLTGVGGLTLDQEDEVVTVTMQLVHPERLLRAVVDGTADEPDAHALVAAMTGTTTLTVTVVLPGGVEHVEASSGLIVTGDEVSAVIDQPLSEFQPGEVAVTGRPGTSGLSAWALPAGAAVVTAGGLLWWWRRRDG